MKPIGAGEHEERAEDLDSSQRVRDCRVAYHLARAITDFTVDKNLGCCNNELYIIIAGCNYSEED